MREALAAIKGTRARFRATFSEFRMFTRGGYGVERALFLRVRGTGDVELTDHVWVVRGKQINAMNLQPGDEVEFTATVEGYWKGYHDDRRYDYRLARQRDFRKYVPATTESARREAGQYLLF
jgi:hypothetical protein